MDKKEFRIRIPALKGCAKTYFNWVTEIRNALKYHIQMDQWKDTTTR